MLDDLKFLHQRDKHDALGERTRFWQEKEPTVAQFAADVPTKDNIAKKLALELMGKSVAIECAPSLLTLAVYWKQSISHRAKHLCWISPVDQKDLSYVVSWSGQPQMRPVVIVQLREKQEDAEQSALFGRVEKLLSGRRPYPVVVSAPTEAADEHMYLSALGDFVAVYLALLNTEDPADATLYNKLKGE